LPPAGVIAAAEQQSQQSLRDLSNDRADEVRMICAHDLLEYEACVAGRLLA
jgi:hypothetical protein